MEHKEEASEHRANKGDLERLRFQDQITDEDGNAGWGRLPNDIIIERYKIDITADPESPTFEGKVAMEGLVKHPTANLTLHAVDMTFTNATLQIIRKLPPQPTPSPSSFLTSLFFSSRRQDDTETITHPLPTTPSTHPTTETATFILPTPLTPTDRIILFLTYTAPLSYRISKGFYRSPYKAPKNTTQHIAATHFEPFGARRAFPCFDEPALKSTFQIIITAPSHLEAISNSPLESVSPSILRKDKKQWKQWTFQKTPVMSTYLVAWAIGDLVAGARGTSTGGTPIRVFTRKGREKEALLALDVAMGSLNVYEETLGVKFPMGKLDLVPVPDFQGEAMENWGLAIFEEKGLMVNPQDDGDSDHRIYVSNLVAHEIVHHWFGDLVTMHWWNDIWLNEAFAEYYQHMGTVASKPSWKAEDLFLEYEHEIAFSADEGFWGSTVWVDSVGKEGVGRMFGDIVYNKGASILRMLQHHLDTPEIPNTPPPSLPTNTTKVCGRFCRSMKRHLEKSSYGTATTQTLLTILDGEDPSQQTSLMLKGWISQKGYPLLVVKEEDDGGMSITQQSWTVMKGFEGGETKWTVPVSYRFVPLDDTMRSPDNATSSSHTILFPSTAEKISLPIHPSTLTLLNAHRPGLFRVQYTPEQYLHLTDLFERSKTPLFTPIDRAGLISDAIALLQSQRLAPAPALHLVKAVLKSETEGAVWRVAARSLVGLGETLGSHVGFVAFRRFVVGVVEEAYGRIGLPVPGQPGDFGTGLARPAVVELVVRYGREGTLRTFLEVFEKVLGDASREGKWRVPEFLEGIKGWVLVGAVRADAWRVLDGVLGNWEGCLEMFGEEGVMRGLAASPHRVHHEILVKRFGESEEVVSALVGMSEVGYETAWRKVLMPVMRRDGELSGGLVGVAGDVVARMDLEGGDLKDVLDVLGVDVGGRRVGDVGVGEWRRKVEGGGEWMVGLRVGLERAWRDGVFRKEWGDEVGRVLEGIVGEV
ncbi:hypothetical protein HDU97_002964 [Phlyctochytrium planicorne]|nr:hypothetical protein HDU97_002964 [Phlyctochytrium planicorne]